MIEEHVYQCSRCGAQHLAIVEAASMLYGNSITCSCGMAIDLWS